jgi:hypothetical protein
MPQLNCDCLFEIFNYLKEDKITLHSCLQVNRSWCEVSVMNLWEEPNISKKVIDTLIICLPNESKNLLFNNGIISSDLKPLISKLPFFNYANYCKVLSISKIHSSAKHFLNDQQSINTKENVNFLTQEILKMFMNVSSLRKLFYTNDEGNIKIPNNIIFVQFSGAKDCLTKLSEFTCTSNVHSEVFNQLSKMCHNIQSLNIKYGEFDDRVSDGLKNLISSQKNLKSLSLTYYKTNHWEDIISSLKKHSNTLVKLSIKANENHWPLSFIKDFKYLKELDISLSFVNKESDFNHFEDLQNFTFPYLKKLNINLPIKVEHIVEKFLENNGENLEEFQSKCKCKISSINHAVNQHCPNLKSLHTISDDLSGSLLENIFKSCKNLESIKILRRGLNLSGKELLKIVAENSPKNFHELKLHNYYTELDTKDLESFFISWEKRKSKKLITLIFKDVVSEKNDEKEEIIKKYEKKGVVKILKM